ncbi:hypothetical protein CWI42_120800 [Ordospora colligata]|uniref:DNA replication complex GINS protein PSF3 n=1 Tax=Ordospora colligata OC4 TaxID=1354746 RepID=A0A0B2UHQ7_9MICR|nr:uncharacterized protein M896_120800 [Ordospora colligata OC4]KHN68858.1 hypothetical protein M896_120800 [Ordospora colligata OC4]TBU13892.1 hypothetical protein CWI40_120800 [Ordospora colligata]TBU14081.1 hypothetical protein CWI41_120800 [Ordospora colligata]TBU17750.1 hypothetical protein CWI42_120800 [Ordospora colligata]
MTYYDIDDIMLNEQKIPITFNHTVLNFGLLGSRACKTISAGKKVDAPYFLVGFLLRNGHCNLSSEFNNEKVMEDIRAKPSAVDLRSVCPYFFYLHSILADSNALLAEFFYERIGDYSPLILKDTFSEDDVWKLEMTERQLIIRARRIFQRFKIFFM